MTPRSIRDLSLALAAALHGAVAAQTADTLPTDPAADAYFDETARRLVLGAKAARDTARLSLDSYTAVIRERMAFEMPAVRRSRPWINGERTARVRWSRDEPTIVHVLAARFRQPLVGGNEPEYFRGLRTERFAADPLGDPFAFGFAVFAQSPEAVATTYSPLEDGSERYYRFRSGDTISVQLSDGSTLQAIAVTVVPRFRSIRLVSAIMWIDPESLGLSRVAYRLAKPVNREFSWQLRSGGRWSPGLNLGIRPLDAADSTLTNTASAATDTVPTSTPTFSDRLVNGALNASLPRFEMDISTVVADYGLWEMRHWLPRSVTWRGHITVAEGVTAAGVVPPSVPAMIDWTLEIDDIRERGADAAPGTPATAAEALRMWRQEGDSIDGEPAAADPGETVTITPADRESLTTSDLLPPSLWEGEGALDPAALERIASELADIGTGREGEHRGAANPWLFDPPVKTLRLLRYNPVEHVSVGTRLHRDFDWGRAALTTRVGTARLELPDIDLTLQRDHSSHRMLVSFYRSLRDGDPAAPRAGAPAVYVTGERADFHWSHGAAVRFLPPAGERNWLSLRLFAEQDADIVSDTKRNRVGAVAAWRPWWGGLEQGSFGGGGRASIRASAGDNPHARAVVEAALVIPLPARLALGMQAGAAGVWGEPAPQDLWRIGGSGSWLRGHSEAVRASRIRMARVDLHRPIRFFRLSVFGDWARASGDDFYAVGAGLVFMDGIIRVDVARGLRRGREAGPDAVFRLHLLDDAFF